MGRQTPTEKDLTERERLIAAPGNRAITGSVLPCA